MKKPKNCPLIQNCSLIQKPILIVGFLLITSIILLGILSLPQRQTAEQEPLIGTNDVRQGNQKISVSIIPNEQAEQTEQINKTDQTDEVKTTPITQTTNTNQNTFIGVNTQTNKLNFKIERFQKLATQPLKFEILNDELKPLTPENLITTNESKLHFYLLHSNLKEFHHLKPEFSNNQWNISANMPNIGTYYAYVVAKDIYGSRLIYKKDLIVRQESDEDIELPHPTNNLEIINNDEKLQMEMKKIENGRLFIINISKNDDPLTPEPYLESIGHLTIIKHLSPETFITTTAKIAKELPSNQLYFETPSLPTGRYTAFIEIKLNGKITKESFTFDIGSI